jgi:uncharacterized membrane protein YGL010W
MSSKIQPLLDEYAESHQNVTNKKIHWVCVPIIFWSIIALFYALPMGFLVEKIGNHIFTTWATVVLLFVVLYYARLSINLSLGMLIFSILCLMLSEFITRFVGIYLPVLAIVVFIVAWIGQFYGHMLEGKKPSFLKDLQFLLIGPAWLMHFIYKKVGLKY